MSGNIIELLQNSIETSTSNNILLNTFLQSCLENGSFYSQDRVEGVVKLINNNLNSTFEKEKGLILLEKFLNQISVEAFSNNALSWMVSCIKISSQKEGINSVFSLKVLSKLIKLSVKFPEVNKEVSKQIVPKFLLDHVRRKSTPQVCVELVECVEACMRHYPGPSGDFGLDVQRLLLACVEGQAGVVEAASRCAPLVAGVGGGGKQGVSHKTAWQRQQLALVRLLRRLLNQLFEHVDCREEESSTVAEEDVELSLQMINDRNILIKTQRLATQFTSVALFLQAMLLEEFPVAKAVAPDAILDVVAHAQKPTLATLGSSREALAVSAVLPTVQVAALQLLESLVLCLGRNLVPHGRLVCYLCSQVIHWTHKKLPDWPYAMDKPFSQSRRAAYGCLESWLSVAGAASQLETVTDKLLPAMLADIHTEKPSVRLQVGSKSGKGRKRQQVLVSQEDRSEMLGDTVANSALCERALLALAALLRTTVTQLKPDAVSSVTNTVLRLVADLPVPYSDANCLTALYQLLLTLCLEPHPRLVPPVSSALTAFTAGSHHPNPTVRATCLAALSSLDKIIHPIAATLYFPVAHTKQHDGVESGEKTNHDTQKKLQHEVEESEDEDQEVMQEKQLLRVESEQEEQEDEEDSMPALKRKRAAFDDEVGPACDLSPPKLILLRDTRSEEQVEVVDLSGSEENCSEEIVFVDISEDEQVCGDIVATIDREVEAISKTVAEINTCSVIEERENGNPVHTLEGGNISHPQLTRKTDENTETEKCSEPEKDQIEEDVSQMLMDFTDEPNV